MNENNKVSRMNQAVPFGELRAGHSRSNITEVIIDLPLEEETSCPVCGPRANCGLFMDVKGIKEHLSNTHGDIKVYWRCSPCEKIFETPAGVSIHKRYCKGEPSVEAGVAGAYKCEVCKMVFDTSRGLSTHEVRKHPSVRNEKRQAQNSASKEGEKTTDRWTAEEVARLRELDQLYRDDSQPNRQISRHWGLERGKTAKQIGTKRKLLGLTGAASTVALEENQTISDPENDISTISTENEDEQVPEILAEKEEDLEVQLEAWRAEVLKNMEAIQKLPGDSDMCEIEDRIDEILTIGDWSDKKEIREKINSICNDLAKSLNNNEDCGVSRPRRQRSKRPQNTKRFEYSRCQDLFKKQIHKLVEMAISGDMSLLQRRVSPPTSEAIRNHYGSLWETAMASPTVQKSYNDTPLVEFGCITLQDVMNRIKKTNKNTAAGPDGIRKIHIMKKEKSSIQVLTKLFNLIVVTGCYPDPWRASRTTLIPKKPDASTNIKSWRPITISSLISRIFSGVMDSKLKRFTHLHHRQKGFTSSNGCSDNVAILASALKEAKELTGGVFVIVDIARAFETIPHWNVSKSLVETGIPRYLSDFIQESYRDTTTEIRSADELVRLEIRRGVRQGDPLSPRIWNCGIDPLIRSLESSGLGLEVEGGRVAALAFADDMVIMGKNKKEVMKLLKTSKEFFERLGMTISLPKCKTFEIIKKAKTYYSVDPSLVIDGQEIPYLHVEEITKYLGARVSSWRGVIKSSSGTDLIDAINRVKSFPLKPWQKLTLIRDRIIPHFLFELIVNKPASTVLKQLDTGIRGKLKEMLNLPHSVNDCLFHVNRGSGGLGIIVLERTCAYANIKHWVQMLGSGDSTLRSIAESETRIKTIERLAQSVELSQPLTLTVNLIEAAKRNYKESIRSSWAALKSQGHGVEVFRNNPLSNQWLFRPWLLKPSRFSSALQMRTNTIGTKTLTSRYSGGDAMCRICHESPETLGHILGQCTANKRARIHRHNEIANIVTKALIQQGWAVIVEPRLEDNASKKFPDIVAYNYSLKEVRIYDVTVRYEKDSSLQEAAKEKITKYESLARELAAKKRFTKWNVVPVVVGSRGAVPPETRSCLVKVGLRRRDIITISLIATRSSIEMIHAFMDYGQGRMDHMRVRDR